MGSEEAFFDRYGDEKRHEQGKKIGHYLE